MDVDDFDVDADVDVTCSDVGVCVTVGVATDDVKDVSGDDTAESVW